MKKILLLLLIFTLLGCSEDEPAPPEEKTGVELIAIGPLNFGGVLVGEFRDAAVQVINYGPEDLDVSALSQSLLNPFTVTSISNPCNSGTLPVDGNCIISVRFEPTVAGEWTQNISLGGSSISTNGKGLIGGLLTMDADLWDLGQFTAGTEFLRTFTFTNEGDFSIVAPSVELVSGTSIGLNTCGNFMAAGSSCTIEIVANKVISGTYDEFITFNSGDAGSLKLQLRSQVSPAGPATLISLEAPPSTIIADGQDTKTVTTIPIRDRFGNIVSDGTNVSLGTNNLTVVGPTTVQTVNGIISFQVQSTTQRGDATVSIFAGEASGFLRLRATAGPPDGVIEVDPYIPELIANGISQLVFKTKPLRDQFNNVVEDGTQVFFFIQGGGSLNVASATTLLGIAQVTLTAPTVKGSAILEIRGGPFDDNGTTAYTASGDFPITYIPGPPDGNIPVVASIGGIYAVENEVEAAGSPIQTALTVGPVLDAQGNVVRTNTEVSVLIENGVNLSVAGTENPSSFFTDEFGLVYFNIAGSGTRGPITMTATSGAANGVGTVWAFKDDNIFYDAVEDNMQVYLKYFSDTSNPSPNLRWGEMDDLVGIEAELDGSTFSFYKRNSTSPIQFANGLPDLMWDCFFTKDKKIFSHPCERRSLSNTQFQNYPDVFPMEFNATINTGSGFSNFVGIDRDANGRVFDNSHDARVNWPGLGYNPISDKGLIFGGGYWEDFQDQNIVYKVFNNSGIAFTSALQTVLTGYDATSDITVANKTPEEGDSGDHPPNMLGMEFTPIDRDLYGFGGMNPLGIGFPFSQFYNFNFNTNRWTNIAPQGDETVSNSKNPLVKDSFSSTPPGRYQHGMKFIPETNSMYMLGGLEFNSDLQAWRRTNDLWKLDFSLLDQQPGSTVNDLSWERLCDGDLPATFCPACDSGQTDPEDPTCGEVQGGVCRNHDGIDIGFVPEPDANPACVWPNAHGQVQAGGDIKKTYILWHHVYQKAFVFWADNPTVKEFDPFTESIIDTSRSIRNMSNRFQVFYSKETGRTFSYQRLGDSNSLMFFWDMEPREKTYIKLDVEIGKGSKDYVQSIVPNIRAWGQTDTGNGVEIFVYNYDTQNWVLWQSNSSIDQSSSQLLTGALTNPTEFVSTEGNLTFLITPKGEASNFNNLDFDFVFISGRF